MLPPIGYSSVGSFSMLEKDNVNDKRYSSDENGDSNPVYFLFLHINPAILGKLVLIPIYFEECVHIFGFNDFL